jgi:hypothetical protein
MSIIAMQASAIQSFKLLPKATLYKMASELFGEVAIYDMNVVTLQNVLARRHFFGALKVVWKEFPSDVVQHMLSFVDMDVNRHTRIRERIRTQYLRADFTLFKIKIGAETAYRYVHNVFGTLVTENIIDTLTDEHARLGLLLENKEAYTTFLQREEQERPEKCQQTKVLRQRAKEAEARFMAERKRNALLREVRRAQREQQYEELAAHEEYMRSRAMNQILQAEKLLATFKNPVQIRELKQQIQLKKDFEARYKALKDHQAAERKQRAEQKAHTKMVRDQELKAINKAAKERRNANEKVLRAQWKQYRADHKRPAQKQKK